MELLGIHHVNIAVGDIDAAQAFYCDILGCTVLDRPDFGFPGLWLDAGGEQIHFLQSDDAPRKGDHFAFQVSDCAATASELEAIGLTVFRIDPPTPGAGRQAFVNDPWGNLLEFNQPD